MTDSFQATYPSTPDGVGAMRREVSAFAIRAGMDDAGAGDVRLAVSEAATNAVLHAYGDGHGDGDVSVRAHIVGPEVVVIVADTGVGLVPRRYSPGLGLGMPLMASVTSSFQVVSRGRGTEVHMAFALPGGDAGALL